MRLYFNNFEKLYSVLAEVSLVVNDASLLDAQRNIVFDMRNGLRFAGVSPIFVLHVGVGTDLYTLDLEDGDEDVLSLPSKELLEFLGSYKNLRRTDVTGVEFLRKGKGKVFCKVHERERLVGELAEGEELKETFSQWAFDPNMIAAPVQLGLDLDTSGIEGELSDVPVDVLGVYTSCMLPLLENATTLYGKLIFGDEHVVVFNRAYTVLMKKHKVLSELLSGCVLYQRALSFLDKVILPFGGDVRMGLKPDGVKSGYLYVCKDNRELYLRYSRELISYEEQLKIYSEEMYVSFDRLYFGDVLKRLTLQDEAITMLIDIENRLINVSNKKFNQDFRLTGLGGWGMDVKKLSFTVSPQVLSKAIVGTDDGMVYEGNEDVILYYCPYKTTAGASMALGDASKGWFSMMRVNAKEVK